MRRRWLLLTLVTLGLLFCAGPETDFSRDHLFEEVVAGVPDYQDFLTVDELHESLADLKRSYPDLISLTVLGETELGNPIYAFRIGEGKHHALLFGFPHPNEPIGSMMLHYLTRVLTENQSLRDYFDFTWHIVICAEPDKAKLNEGWFKGDLTLTKYARHYYRPPSYQQVEWTFPVTYRKYTFDAVAPESRALMKIIDNNPISFSFGLHNSGFGGVYYYWSHDVPELYSTLYDAIKERSLPLHLGEPEVPWGKKFDDKSMFEMIYFTGSYDYMEKYSPVPPEEILKSGASSDDYLKSKHGSLTVNCELPYFYDPRIEDTSPSDTTRREAHLQTIASGREALHALRNRFKDVQELLTTGSPFLDVLEEQLRVGKNQLDTMENTVTTDPEYERVATVAEKWDALNLRKFYRILTHGQFIRLLEHEKETVGDKFPKSLQEVLDESLDEFETKAVEMESELDYSVVPIRKLASIQLLTALYSMDHLQNHPELVSK